ncbi:hypothetical protein GRX03_02450 [Halovenus sp. WSH3]|uniref:Uncharacterized protein n=1 Tax=Halovenus carboxidivorans TaxID=2692199 RepID=A0A6B0SZM4_9EURY|nr:hypothetical protein [Halovenus carboxidivorans]MXR50467.1 hypothetical protein [Halovenus carboxidivorans]
MSGELPYIAKPNRVISSGAETLDAIALSLVVESDRLVIEARTGTTSDREIVVDHDQIYRVELVEGVAPEIEIETRRTEYVVTGVADSLQRARRIARTIRRLSNGGSEPAGGDPAGTERRSSAGHDHQSEEQPPTLNTGRSDDGRSRVYPSETLHCPACDQKAEVPEEIPESVLEVTCPGCSITLGRVDDEGESVIIDPDL